MSTAIETPARTRRLALVVVLLALSGFSSRASETSGDLFGSSVSVPQRTITFLDSGVVGAPQLLANQAWLLSPASRARTFESSNHHRRPASLGKGAM